MSVIEAAAAASIALSVLLTVRRSLWLWPIGIAGTCLYLAVFWQARLYFSAALQVFFLAVQVYGWWWWASSRAGRERPIARLGRARTALAALATIVAALAAGATVQTVSDASRPFADALIAGGSVTAQVLLSRKVLENWIFWIAVDALAVGVYASQGLHLTAALYGALLAMASWGLWEWRRPRT